MTFVFKLVNGCIDCLELFVFLICISHNRELDLLLRFMYLRKKQIML